MEKRILFAFLLSAAVLFGSRMFLAPKPVPSPAPASVPAAVPAAVPSPQAPAAAAGQTVKEVRAEAPPEPQGEIQAGQAEDVQFETALLTATFSNHGAVLKSFKLKYPEGTGKSFELIDQAGAAKVGWPMAVLTDDPKLDETLAAADFVAQRDAQGLAMEFAAKGIHARKNFVFDPQNFAFTVETSLTRDGKAVPHSIVWQSGFGDQSIPPNPAKFQVMYPNGTSYKKLAVSGIKEPQEMTVPRVGLGDQFFVAMFLLPGNGATIKISKQEYTGGDGKAVATNRIAVPSSGQPIRLYVGPQDTKLLAKVDPGLVSVVDYGFFGFIAKPLTSILLWVHGFIGNFGWSIVVLTVLINLALFPLRLKQQVSMQKMSKVQPQMRTLQDKYKKLKPNDPRRVEVQSQMMNLYKEHGINPLSGCIPLLIQMPFLFAFWSMLNASIELRGAPWMFWIHDLSLKDPYYLMPILMAVSMLVTQKMTPSTVDPAQAKMMMIMPLMFTVMFLSSPSGLMLYWLTSNIVGIGQQVLINKYWAPAVETGPRNKVRKIETTE